MSSDTQEKKPEIFEKIAKTVVFLAFLRPCTTIGPRWRYLGVLVYVFSVFWREKRASFQSKSSLYFETYCRVASTFYRPMARKAICLRCTIKLALRSS